MTFTQSLTTFADRVLDKTLGTVDAGACVIEHNTFCACVTDNFCHLLGKQLWVSFSCFGACGQFTSQHCCG
jgi:hypothetical protein